MTIYEMVRKSMEPMLLPLHKQVGVRLRNEIRSVKSPIILDVGGRKSPYTIALRARVNIIDLPRKTELQTALNLGVSERVLNQLKSRRSNVEDVILADMTSSSLASSFYDFVVSVEVLEHVEDDEKFVSEVSRVLKPGGRFIMTTPNGDFVENHNPDHKRHYKRNQLTELLKRHFGNVNVEYAIAGGYFRKLGLRSWSATRPIRTMSSIVGNIVNSAQSSRRGVSSRAVGTHHLIACAEKSLGENGQFSKNR